MTNAEWIISQGIQFSSLYCEYKPYHFTIYAHGDPFNDYQERKLGTVLSASKWGDLVGVPILIWLDEPHKEGN